MHHYYIWSQLAAAHKDAWKYMREEATWKCQFLMLLNDYCLQMFFITRNDVTLLEAEIIYLPYAMYLLQYINIIAFSDEPHRHMLLLIED